MKQILLAIVIVLLSSFNIQAAELEYNYMEDRWEFIEPGDELRYNYFENEWSYENPDAELDYNYFEDEWQWDKE